MPGNAAPSPGVHGTASAFTSPRRRLRRHRPPPRSHRLVCMASQPSTGLRNVSRAHAPPSAPHLSDGESTRDRGTERRQLAHAAVAARPGAACRRTSRARGAAPRQHAEVTQRARDAATPASRIAGVCAPRPPSSTSAATIPARAATAGSRPGGQSQASTNGNPSAWANARPLRVVRGVLDIGRRRALGVPGVQRQQGIGMTVESPATARRRDALGRRRLRRCRDRRG